MMNTFWLVLGFIAQGLFAARFWVQWIDKGAGAIRCFLFPSKLALQNQ